MAKVKRIVCLANSRKLSGRCVAGKELVKKEPGQWVRPVSDRPSQEVSEHERQYQDGSDPRVLDVIDITFAEHRPKSYQTENWLLDPHLYWVRVGRTSWKDLLALADEPPSLWKDGSSTYSGLNDRVSLADSEDLNCSLYLIHLKGIKFHVFAPGANFGNPKRRVQAAFSYRGGNYRMWVTDPIVEKMYLAKNDGEYEIGECFITVSLGEPHEGYCYKLVATVITPDVVESCS
jgi:hypothetical protein